jgi:hypothetical protein
MADMLVGNPPAANPHPAQQAVLIDANDEDTGAPAPSGSFLVVPAAQGSILMQGLRRSARNVGQV